MEQLESALRVDDLSLSIGGAKILDGISLSVNKNEVLGIIGPNGAGKTTLLNVLAGIEKPSTGEVLINGINIHSERDKIKGIIGYVQASKRCTTGP